MITIKEWINLFNKIGETIKLSLDKVDFEKIQREIDASLKSIDWKKINTDVKNSIDKIDFNRIKIISQTGIKKLKTNGINTPIFYSIFKSLYFPNTLPSAAHILLIVGTLYTVYFYHGRFLLSS